MEKKLFTIYELEVDGNVIENVTTPKGVKTKIAHSFYMKHQEELDEFENISEWVKPETKPREPNTNRITVDVETEDVRGHDLSVEKIEEAIAVLKNFKREQDPEYKKAKEELKEIEKVKENFKTLGIEVTQDIIDRENKAKAYIEEHE